MTKKQKIIYKKGKGKGLIYLSPKKWKEKCYLCGEVFRGSLNSISRQRARHLGGGWCKGIRGFKL